MKTPETKEEFETAIKKLKKAQKKWYCPERKQLIDKYSDKLENLK